MGDVVCGREATMPRSSLQVHDFGLVVVSFCGCCGVDVCACLCVE